MPEQEKKGRTGIVWISVVLALGLLLFVTPMGRMFLSMFFAMGHTKLVEAKLRKPEVYKPVARTLALYCQSDQNLIPPYLSYAWLPPELAQVRHGRCSIATNHALVEMGGGFYHFGYRLDVDSAASTSVTNVWQLALYREGSQDVHLTTLSLTATQHLDATQIEKLVLAGFEESLKHGDPDAYKGKVLVHLRFGNTSGAAETCKTWIYKQPERWLPHFTYAHVRCRQGDQERASAEFSSWVHARQNFAYCVYLALFHFREGRTNGALEAVRLVLKQPFVEPPDTDGNKFCLGHNAALMAYISGDYDLALALCDKMLRDPAPERWWRRKLLRLKAATSFLKGDRGQAADLMRQAESYADGNSFSGESMAKADKALRTAIEKNNTEFIKQFQNCVDELDSWFSPFETDETGIHGSGLKIPTPYPSSWKTDKMMPDARE